jgi:hypothetical protein
MIADLTAADAFGALGTIFGATWSLFRSRRGMLLAQAMIGILFGLHYALLGAYTGSLMNALAALQALAAIPLGTRPEFRKVYLLTLPLIAGGLWLTWTGLPSLFAALGMTLISIGRYQTDPVRFRMCMSFAIPNWAVHNWMVWSVPGLISDAFGLLFNVINTVRDVRARRAPAAAG